MKLNWKKRKSCCLSEVYEAINESGNSMLLVESGDRMRVKFEDFEVVVGTESRGICISALSNVTRANENFVNNVSMIFSDYVHYFPDKRKEVMVLCGCKKECGGTANLIYDGATLKRGHRYRIRALPKIEEGRLELTHYLST